MPVCLLTCCYEWSLLYNKTLVYQSTVFCSSLSAGNGRTCLPRHFHYRNLSEDYRLRFSGAPERVCEKRMEHAGFCHRRCRVGISNLPYSPAAHSTGIHLKGYRDFQ